MTWPKERKKDKKDMVIPLASVTHAETNIIHSFLSLIHTNLKTYTCTKNLM